MRILIAGAGGMLGHDVLAAALRAGHEPLALTRAELDICDATAVEHRLATESPDAVINCAAFTDVDGAQTQVQQARAVNATGAGNLAAAAAAAGITLLHVSSDYVFDGVPRRDPAGAPRAYRESDQTGPLSVYGETKLEGERLVLAASPRHLVVRSSWLFGVAGRNFAETMLRLASEREAVKVVDDQVGCPTWTGHLAPALIGLLERDLSGVVHLAGSGAVSWNGFAKEIFRQAQLDCRVEAIASAEMARPAPRPAWSVLESERDDVIPMPEWRDGLEGYLAARAGMMKA
ncbi:MAG TPA: dTDP-4-dehydrorhamnose reductase [Solirubrobacteraceae bacterium]|jgi:dTDP-4-dehydrorhamnose reductase